MYGSTVQIDLEHARRDKRTIATAVTPGVVVKAALIGVVLAVVWRDPLYLLLGVAVAQIDPLAVAAVVKHPRMPPRARSILAAWSSFDDPITVLLSVYAAAFVVGLGGGVSDSEGAGAGAYVGGIGLNLAVAALVFGAWQLVRRWPTAVYALLALVLLVSVWFFTWLAVAIAGLFIRPPLGKHLNTVISAALVTASFMLGFLLIDGLALLAGVSLGVAAFTAHIVVAYVITRNLSTYDRMYLVFAQQNGITAIVLALVLETQFDGVVAIVAPAIVIVSVLYLTANAIVDKYGLANEGVSQPEIKRLVDTQSNVDQ